MNRINLKKIPLPGLRNIKTAISVLICLLIYEATGGEGIMLAVIAAIICMQDSVEKSYSTGKFRVFGTIMGGLFGVFFTYVNFAAMNYFIWLFACIIGLILLIHLINVSKKQDSVVIGCIVFLIIVLEPGEETATAIIYAVNRVLDTLVGIVVAVLVNRWLFNPKPDRVTSGESIMNLDYEIRKESNQKISKWSGGITKEIFISPKYSLYAERDFNWRISTATVELEESKFTNIPDYLRHIMVLEGRMRLVHEGQHTINLEEYDQDFFSGNWDTNSYGKCTDFNLMLKEGFVGLMECIYNNENNDLVKMHEEDEIVFSQSGFYILKDKVCISVSGEGKNIFNTTLNKGDFVIFNELNHCKKDSVFISISSLNKGENTENKDILAIRVDIAQK